MNFTLFLFNNYIPVVFITIICLIFLLLTVNTLYTNFVFTNHKLKNFFIIFSILTAYFLYFYTLFVFILFDCSPLPYQLWFNCRILNFDLIFLIDSLTLIFLLLLTFLIPISLILNVWHSHQILMLKKQFSIAKDFCAFKGSNKIFKSFFFIFFLEFTLFFFFTTSDLFFFYIFFEVSLFPLFFMIGAFGSRSNKIIASYYIFFFTVFGSILFFIAILYIYYVFGTTNFFLLAFCCIPLTTKRLLWFFVFIAFSIKIPVFPFHIWLPEAHVEASTEGSILLAGILLKIGLYGILRFLIPLFPKTTLYFIPLVQTLALVTILYVSCIIFVQLDIKKIIAYSSIIHMNFILLGLLSSSIDGIQGALYLIFIHGFISPGLFAIVGFIYSRYNSRLLFYYQGLQTLYPLLSVFFFFLMLANLGLPGTGGFIGELMILLGLFSKNVFIAFFSLISPLFSSLYSLLLYSRVFQGSLSLPVKMTTVNYQSHFFYFYSKVCNKRFFLTSIVQMTSLEFYILLNFSVFVLFSGVFPNIFLWLTRFFSVNLYLCLT